MIVKRQDLMDAVKSLTFKSHLIGDWVDKLRVEVSPCTLKLTITDTSLWLIRLLDISSEESWSVVIPLSGLRKTLQHMKDEEVEVFVEDNLVILRDRKGDYLSVPTIVVPKFPEVSNRALLDSREFEQQFIDSLRFIIGLQDSEVTDSRWYFVSVLSEGWLIGGSPGCTGLVKVPEGFSFNLRSETAKIVSRMEGPLQVNFRDRQLVFGDSHKLNVYAIAERSAYPYTPTDLSIDGEAWIVDRLSLYTAVQTLKQLSGEQTIYGRFVDNNLNLTVPKFRAQKSIPVTGPAPSQGWAVNSTSLLNVLKRLRGDKIECLQNKKKVRLADQYNQLAVLTRYAIR